MIDSLFCLLALSTGSTPGALPCPAPTLARPAVLASEDEDEDEKVDKRDDIKELLATLKAHVKERGEEDREAIAIIDQVLVEFPNCGPKDRAAIVKSVAKTFEAKRQEQDDGSANNMLYRAAALSLGEMGPESAKPLSSWIGDKRHRKDLVLQRDLIRSLGKTRSEKGIRTLVDLLNHHQASLQAVAAEALANYEESDQKERKELFEAVLKILTDAKGSVDSNINDTIARDRYDTIAASMITTLQTLSGHKERKPEEWRRWWNKNKKRNWDEED